MAKKQVKGAYNPLIAAILNFFVWDIWIFDICVCFEFRASDLEFSSTK